MCVWPISVRKYGTKYTSMLASFKNGYSVCWLVRSSDFNSFICFVYIYDCVLNCAGISDSRMSSMLALDFSGSGSSSSPEYAIDIRDSAVMWVNDIEHDKQYRRWSDSLMELLRPTFPGMLRSVRRNLYNLVSVHYIRDMGPMIIRDFNSFSECFPVICCTDIRFMGGDVCG